MEENRIVRERRSAANIVMDRRGNIRPLIDEFKRGAEARVFLNQRAFKTIQSYLPGQKLQYFRENRLSIFRIRSSGIIDVLKELNITTFTREEVFMVIRANNIAGLHYMLEVHPTMIQDHATTYTSEDIVRQLRSNEPVGVLEHMHRLDPSMFENTNLRPVFYRHLRFGDLLFHPGIPDRGKNLIETFKMLARLLNITEFTGEEFYTAMRSNHPEIIDYMFRLHPTIGRDIGKVAIISFFAPHNFHENTVVSILQNVLLADNPLHRLDLTPDDLTQLMTFQMLLTNHANNRRIVDLINGHVVTNEMFPRLVHQYLNDFELDWERSTFLTRFIEILLGERQYNEAGELVGEGNLYRINQVIDALTPVTPAVVNMILQIEFQATDNPDVIQRFVDHVTLDPDATRPGSRSSSGARFSGAPSSAAASSSAGFFSASPSSAAASSSAGFVSAPSSDAGFFLFSYA
jgi:hypothetical protein